MNNAKTIQESIDIATSKALIDGAMCASGWVYLYLGTQTVKLRDDVAAIFLDRLADPNCYQEATARIYHLECATM